MKITIVLGAFFPVPPTMGGAVEKVWFGLAPEFVRQGHQVTLVSRAQEALPREEVLDGVRHLRVPGFNAPASLLRLKFCDLIYSWRVKSVLPPADILVTNTFWLPLLARDRSRGKLYVHVARYPKGQLNWYKAAARLQAPSQAVADAIKAQAPSLADRVRIVPYPAPAPIDPAPAPACSNRAKLIVYVGRVHPEKGVHLLVEAFAAHARTIFADWKLMIVGPTEERLGGGGAAYADTLAMLAKPAPGQIDFHGPVFDPAALERIFRDARLFVYPSLAEGGESFGLAPLEAMTHGCAVLVSDLACFRDFIHDGETGFVFNHREPGAAGVLADKLQELATNEAAVNRVAEAGYAKAKEYSSPRIAEQFLQDFSSLG